MRLLMSNRIRPCTTLRFFSASLLLRNFRALDHFGPAFYVAVEQRGQLLWRTALCDEREISETLFHIGQREDASDFSVEFADDFFWCFCVYGEPVPRRGAEFCE